MDLTSLIFLLAFLPLSVCLYYVFGRGVRPVIIVFFSLIFYGMGSPKYFFLLLGMTVITCGMGQFLFMSKARSVTRHNMDTAILVAGVLLNIFPLLYYKYTDFVRLNINRALGTNFELKNYLLPLGISFFTFKSISFLVDVYRGKIARRPNIWCCMSYLCFFGQIVSGPLSRYDDFENIAEKRCNVEDLYQGVRRIIYGLGKKVILADLLSRVANEIFAKGTDELSTALAWLGAIVFSLELFFDFSGYSDIAIGISRLFGISCNENFDYPYMSSTVSEFWRRWHISLGAWFRDYIYIPLGGSKCTSAVRTYANLLVVWLLTGIWHGASWNYVIWGMMNFVMIAFERKWNAKDEMKNFLWRHCYRPIVLLFFMVQWVVFRANGIKHAAKYLLCMFLPVQNELATARAVFLCKEYVIVIVCAMALCFPLRKILLERFEKQNVRMPKALMVCGEWCLLLLVFCVAISFMIAGINNPFTYGNF